MVCSCDLGHPLNLARIMVALMDHERVEYEPEVFPGLVWRISDQKIVFLLFSSGKIIITGERIGKTSKQEKPFFRKNSSVVAK
jgi:transcription initiation factor TFIID TATA-box-binding protein